MANHSKRKQIQMTLRRVKINKKESMPEIQVSDLDTSTEIEDNDS